MNKNRLAGIFSIVLMLFFCIAAAMLYGKNHMVEIHDSYAEELPAAPVEENPLKGIREDFTLTEEFSTHLPIVILDMGGEEPPINTYYQKEHEKSAVGLYVPIEGLDPYVEGTISILENEGGMNTLKDEPVLTSQIRIKRRGNTSMYYEKAQWTVKTVTESGQDNDVDVLGMGAEHTWILNGSMYDKSMLRNYLAYSISSKILNSTPDSRYCEVVIKNRDSYTYQGVYLMLESVEQGVDRVDIAEYHSKDTFNSYLVRRDRFDVEALTLDNYGHANGYSKEYMAVIYPSKCVITQDMTDYINRDINYIEKIIYSDNPDEFITYPEVIDVDSFIDYFLVNEYFGNYDAGNNSTYFYKDMGGKLVMGPVWDFDGAMDNYMYEPLETESLAFYTKPWFDRLCKDAEFVDKLEARYVKLRQSELSNQNVVEKIDEIIAYLGGAQEREWMRWSNWYRTENKYSLQDYVAKDGTVLHRNAITYEDEIFRIKTALREHGDSIADALKHLEKDTRVTTGFEIWMGYLLLLATAVFFIPAVFVSFKK